MSLISRVGYERLKKELGFSYNEDAVAKLRGLLGNDNVVVRF